MDPAAWSIRTTLLTAAAALLAPGALADPTDPPAEESTSVFKKFEDAVAAGEAWLNFRLRYEHADIDNPALKAANASTLRTRLGYKTAQWNNLSGLIEFHNLSQAGLGDFNSTTNGKTDYALVPDPSNSRIDQVYAQWNPADQFQARYGRQRKVWDNQRWVGSVAWRQTDQVFDGLTLGWSPVENLDLEYLGFYRAHTIFGSQSPVGRIDVDSHNLNAGYTFQNIGKLTGYYYYVDFENPNPIPTFGFGSTGTLGARFAGKHPFSDSFSLLYEAEYANQKDVGNNPNQVDSDYAHAMLGGNLSGITAKIAYEVLGGSGNPGDRVTTPFGTNHKFNGWTDVFLFAPDVGLKDTYFHLGYAWSKFSLAGIYHDFEGDTGGEGFGNEFDAVFSWKALENLTVAIKYAAFDANSGNTLGKVDVTRFWGWIDYQVL